MQKSFITLALLIVQFFCIISAHQNEFKNGARVPWLPQLPSEYQINLTTVHANYAYGNGTIEYQGYLQGLDELEHDLSYNCLSNDFQLVMKLSQLTAQVEVNVLTLDYTFVSHAVVNGTIIYQFNCTEECTFILKGQLQVDPVTQKLSLKQPTFEPSGLEVFTNVVDATAIIGGVVEDPLDAMKTLEVGILLVFANNLISILPYWISLAFPAIHQYVDLLLQDFTLDQFISIVGGNC